MKSMPSRLGNSTFRHFLGASIVCCLVALPMQAGAQPTPANPVPAPVFPGDSVYQVAATLTDQDGRAFRLGDHRGKPVLVSMFYTSCKFVCPMLIDTMALTQQSLGTGERARLDLLLISFDPARDDIQKLKSVAGARDLNPAQWTLARTDATSVRKIAAALGIQYRLLSDGEYNHTTVLVLLDAEGRMVGQTKKIGTVDTEFIKLVKKVLGAPSPTGP